jgi:hypothetical protein
MTSSLTALSGGWASFLALTLAFLVPAIAPSYGVGLAVPWAASVVLLIAFCVALGVAINERPAGMIIDNRNRVSLSKLQAAAWSILVLSAVITAVFARIRWKYADPVGIGLPGDLLAVMGISATTLVAAPVILSLKAGQSPPAGQEALTAAKLGDDVTALASTGKVYARADASAAQWLDLFRGEEVSNAASPDLSKVQQFLITVVVLAVYAAALWSLFEAPEVYGPKGAWLADLPPFSEKMLWLIGISHAGYLAYKAAPHGGSAAASGPAADDAVG